MIERTAGARYARHHGADGDFEDQSDVLVLEFFDVAERRLKLVEGFVDCGLVVEADEVIFRSEAGVGGVEEIRMVFEEDGARSCDAGARSEKCIAEDAEY